MELDWSKSSNVRWDKSLIKYQSHNLYRVSELIFSQGRGATVLTMLLVSVIRVRVVSLLSALGGGALDLLQQMLRHLLLPPLVEVAEVGHVQVGDEVLDLVDEDEGLALVGLGHQAGAGGAHLVNLRELLGSGADEGTDLRSEALTDQTEDLLLGHARPHLDLEVEAGQRQVGDLGLASLLGLGDLVLPSETDLAEVGAEGAGDRLGDLGQVGRTRRSDRPVGLPATLLQAADVALEGVEVGLVAGAGLGRLQGRPHDRHRVEALGLLVDERDRDVEVAHEALGLADSVVAGDQLREGLLANVVGVDHRGLGSLGPLPGLLRLLRLLVAVAAGALALGTGHCELRSVASIATGVVSYSH